MDPMFPHKTKTALNKKEMRLFSVLTGGGDQDYNTENLFTLAKKKATKRVVVKRPIKSPYMHDTKPEFQVLGKAIRFDVYLV